MKYIALLFLYKLIPRDHYMRSTHREGIKELGNVRVYFPAVSFKRTFWQLASPRTVSVTWRIPLGKCKPESFWKAAGSVRVWL